MRKAFFAKKARIDVDTDSVPFVKRTPKNVEPVEMLMKM